MAETPGEADEEWMAKGAKEDGFLSKPSSNIRDNSCHKGIQIGSTLFS
jgi:hypothetical protein